MATTTGTMTSQVTSTASSPNVNYSAAYTATRASDNTETVSVKLDFAGWLNSSASQLGTGIKLTIYARIDGGSWSSVVLKDTSVSWSGTTKHSVSLTLSTSTTASTAKIEWYVSRTGSTYSGTAGTLGSSSSPQTHTINIPAYSAVQYTVTYSVSGDIPSGYTVPTDSTAYASGATVTVKSVPTADGYTFAGWYRNGSIVTSFQITADTTLTGIWTRTRRPVYVTVSATPREGAPYVTVSEIPREGIQTYVNVDGVYRSN